MITGTYVPQNRQKYTFVATFQTWQTPRILTERERWTCCHHQCYSTITLAAEFTLPFLATLVLYRSRVLSL